MQSWAADEIAREDAEAIRSAPQCKPQPAPSRLGGRVARLIRPYKRKFRRSRYRADTRPFGCHRIHRSRGRTSDRRYPRDISALGTQGRVTALHPDSLGRYIATSALAPMLRARHIGTESAERHRVKAVPITVALERLTTSAGPRLPGQYDAPLTAGAQG